MDMEMMFKVGGKKDEMDDADRAKVAEFIQRRVGGFRCPDHDKLPTVMVGGTSLGSLSFEVKGCCQKVIHMVQSKLEA